MGRSKERKTVIYTPPLLTRIEAELNSNAEVFIAGSNLIEYEPPYNSILEIIDIYVAPKEPLIYYKDLNSFARNLVKVRATYFNPSYESIESIRNKSIRSAEINFKEPLRLITIEAVKKTTTWNNSGEETTAFENLPTKDTIIKRGVNVKVFPSKQLAKLVLDYDKAHQGIERDKDREFVRNLDWASLQIIKKLNTFPVEEVSLEIFKQLLLEEERIQSKNWFNLPS